MYNITMYRLAIVCECMALMLLLQITHFNPTNLTDHILLLVKQVMESCWRNCPPCLVYLLPVYIGASLSKALPDLRPMSAFV